MRVRPSGMLKLKHNVQSRPDKNTHQMGKFGWHRAVAGAGEGSHACMRCIRDVKT